MESININRRLCWDRSYRAQSTVTLPGLTHTNVVQLCMTPADSQIVVSVEISSFFTLPCGC